MTCVHDSSEERRSTLQISDMVSTVRLSTRRRQKESDSRASGRRSWLLLCCACPRNQVILKILTNPDDFFPLLWPALLVTVRLWSRSEKELPLTAISHSTVEQSRACSSRKGSVPFSSGLGSIGRPPLLALSYLSHLRRLPFLHSASPRYFSCSPFTLILSFFL